MTIVLDRAGLTGTDGASHNGMWDMALFCLVPGPRGRRHDPDAAAGVIGVGADGVGREAEAAGDVRDGEAVDGRERWRRS